MKTCPNCGTKLPSEAKFCTSCGASLENVPSTSEIREERRSQRRKKIESQDESINVFYRLAFTRKHMLQVLNFMEDNALTLLIMSILMIIPWWTNWVRVILFVVYALMIYTYPLLSNKKRFVWDESLENWLNDENNISNLKSSAKQVVDHVQSEINTKVQESKEKREELREKQQKENLQTVIFVPDHGPKPEIQQLRSSQNQKDTPRKNSSGFMLNYELIVGIILAVIGGFMYFNEKSQMTSVSGQLLSVIKNGGLNDAGYAVIWGAIGLGIGVFATIGGLLKAMMRKPHGGGVMKALGVVIVFVAGCLASYAYSNPISTAENAISSGVNLSNIQTIIQIVKFIPWAAGLSYVIGILLNIGSRDN